MQAMRREGRGYQLAMILVIPYCKKDHAQASRLAEWIDELGPYPKHQILIVRQTGAAEIFRLKTCGFSGGSEILVNDSGAAWPTGPNAMFRAAGKQIEYGQKLPWLLCEPDAVPMREGWLDEIEAEYLACGRPFLGDFIVPPKNSDPKYIPHISGMAVYPPNLMHYAGEIYHAYDNIPFDVIAGPQILAQAKQSELLFHVWQGPGQPGLAPFTSWQDVEQKIFARRPKCALFHSDKSGTLLGLLRERKNFSGGVEALDTQSTADGVTSSSGEVAAPPAETISGKEGDATSIPHPAGNSLVVSAEPTSQPESSADPSTFETLMANSSENPAWSLERPWLDRAASIAEIKGIANRLRQFQTAPMTTHQVRELLVEAGVITPVRKRRKKKK